MQRPTRNAQRRESTGQKPDISLHSTLIPSDAPAGFRRSLLAWHRKNGRHDLPWRRTRDPYAVVVSEFMLQQTQVAAVIPYFERWMRRFPNFNALAAAPEREVLHAWQGLGYYARAHNLHAAAQIIVTKYGGRFPSSPEAIRRLPGIGRYTTNAILSFAFNRSLPIIETNTARLFSRLFNLEIPIDSGSGREQLWLHAANLLPKRNSSVYHAALMDLGALVCRPRPACDICPVQLFCRAKDPLQLPLRKAQPSLRFHAERHGFVINNGGVLLEKSQERWQGMWILPRLTSTPPRTKPLYTSRFPFTNHRVTLIVFPIKVTRRPQGSLQRWFPIDGLASLPLPSPHRRALETLVRSRHQIFPGMMTRPDFSNQDISKCEA